MVPGDKRPISPRVQGEKSAKVQASSGKDQGVQQRVQACAPQPAWQQERREETSGAAKGFKDDKAGEGPCEIVSGE